jgi:hypothetical protein
MAATPDDTPHRHPGKNKKRLLLMVALFVAVCALGIWKVVSHLRTHTVVATLDLGAAGQWREVDFPALASTRYELLEDYAFDESGVGRGPERQHCYVWEVEVRQGGQKQLLTACPAFLSFTCTTHSRSDGAQSGTGCDTDCGFQLASAGQITARVRLRETTSCRGSARYFHYDLKPTRLEVRFERRGE